MRVWRGWLYVFAAVGLAAVWMSLGSGLAAGASLPSAAGGVDSPLVVSGAEWLLGNQRDAADAARRANPEAIGLRAASVTAFHGLDAAGAERLARESFRGILDGRNGGPPILPAGERIVRFDNSSTAQIDLGHSSREHALVVSSEPMAVQSSPGRWKGLDLGLRRSGKGFVGATTLVPARLPERLSEGAQLPSAGLTITPVDAHGKPLGGTPGAITGASVFVANTRPDSDTLFKLSTLGLAVDAMLRAQDSPEKLFYRVAGPAGSHLTVNRQGRVQVVEHGKALADVPAPSAFDAEGTPVPVGVWVAGDVLTLTVRHPSGAYRYPIEVDPEFNTTTESKVDEKTWKKNPAGTFHVEYEFPSRIEIWTNSFTSGQYGSVGYTTKGTSKIYEINATTESGRKYTNGTQTFLENHTGENYIQFLEPKGSERRAVVAKENVAITEFPTHTKLCAEGLLGCSPERGEQGNTVSFYELATIGNSVSFWFTIEAATLSISQPKETHSTVSYNTSSTELEVSPGVKTPNVLHNGGWIGPKSGGFEFESKDAGLGVSATGVEFKKGSTWEKIIGLSRNYLTTNACVGVQCAATEKEVVTYEALGGSHLVDGESNPIRVSANDPMEKTSSLEHGEGETTLKVDKSAPFGLGIGGLKYTGNNWEIDESLTNHLYAVAYDGVSGTPSSGIKSISVYVDGREIGSPNGSCSPGPCQTEGKWLLNGGALGAGNHTLTEVATDNAGNTAERSEKLIVYHAGATSIGPGTANVESGNFALSATDVSMSGGMGSLTVTRHYQSRNPTAGVTGPLGPQWSIGLAAAANTLEVMPDGTVLFQGEDAGVIFVRKNDGKFESAMGDRNVTLEAVEQEGKVTAYMIKNVALGTTTRYTRPVGAEEWLPTVSEGPNSTTTTTDEYTTAEPERGKKIVQPVLEVAPHGTATCAFKNLQKGCRALEFNYAASTTAAGEGQSEWGDYKGNLTRVYFIAWDPTAKEMKTITVAQYSYDSKGRLRAVWDPRISPALKTVYGYDTEGHVTALTPPGRETWALTYGTVPGDTTPGRLLKATEAPASASLWEGATVSSTETPTISGTPIVGNRLAVTDGVWSGSPVVYGYQWEDCNSAGAECVPIAGATNANYTAASSDLGHRLVVLVTATNGGGSVTVNSVASSPIVMAVGTSSLTVDTGKSLNAVSCVPGTSTCAIADSSGNAFYSTNVTTASAGSWTAWTGPGVSPSEAMSCPSTSLCLLATGTNEYGGGNLFQATSLGGSWTTAVSDKAGVISVSCPSTSFCATGDMGSDDHWSTTPASSWPGKSHLLPYTSGNNLNGISCLSSSFCVVANSKGEIYVAATTAQLESTEWTKTNIDGTKALNGVACTATNSCVAVDGSGQAFKLAVGSGGAVTSTSQAIDSGHSLTAVTCTANSTCVTVDDHGNVFVSYNAGESWNGQYKLGDDLTGVSCASSSLCVAVDTTGTVNVFDTAPTTQTIDSGNSLNAISCTPTAPSNCVATDSKGNAFYTTNASSSAAATWTAWTGVSGMSPSEAVYCATKTLCLMASGSKSGYGGNLYYATSFGGTWTPAVSPSYGVDAISCGSNGSTYLCVGGQDGLGYFRYATSPASTSWTLEQQGSAAQTAVACLTESFCAMADGAGTVRVATSTTQIKSSAWTETKVDGTTPLTGIACRTTSWCVAVDNSGNVIGLTINGSGQATAKSHAIDGVNSFTGVSCASGTCVAVDSKGNAFISTEGETWTQEDQLAEGMTGLSCNAFCLAAGNSGGIDKLSGRSVYEGGLRSPQPGMTVEYNVPVSGSGAPYSMSSSDVGKWGQTDLPVTATAVFPSDEPQGWPATDYKRALVYYIDRQARATNTVNPGGGITTTEFDESNDPVRALSAANRAKAMEEGAKSAEVAKALDSESVYSEGKLTETVGPQHTVKIVNGNEKVPSGSEVPARQHVKFYYDEGSPGLETYEVVTKKTEGALTSAGEEFDVRTTTNSYSGQSNLGWKLRKPTSTTVDPAGLKITHTTLYDENTGAIVETRGPASPGAGDPRDAVTVYYTATANSSYPSCGEHIEWAGLVCETLAGKQPETPGLPALPVTATQYNIWDQAEVVTETFGSTTRTKKTTFDAGGRALKSEVTSANGVAVPAVTDTYDEKTGALVKQSELVEGKEKATQTKYDARGRAESYTDADGAKTTFEYDVADRLTSMTQFTPEVQVLGKQTYIYDSATGRLNELTDSAAGTFTASYDASGQMVSETYPNKMTATFAHNATGETTGIEYRKTAYCATSCPEKWSSDEVVPSIHGQVLKESGTLGEEPKLVYDAVGRLTEVQEIPTGQGCTTRIYGYDQESNRISLTTRAPGTEGKCATEGGVSENHTYDLANRLTDSGVTYEAFGDITKVPSSDAGGAGMEITSTYYADGQLATQEQNGKATSYYMDPMGRVRETRTPGVSVMHYAAPGQIVAWTAEPESKWTRNIGGIDGTLAATQSSTGGTTFMVHDLQGDTVGTASSDEKQTKLLTTYKSTEFGVPVNGTPPKFSWLGALGISTESPSGLVVQQGSTYVPQIGRPLQASVVLPIPTNAVGEYEMALASWAIEDGAAFAKQFTEAAEAARKAAEGELQIWESGEAGGGEEEEATASSIGSPACTAHWDLESESERLYLRSFFKCDGRVSKIMMGTCLYRSAEGEVRVVACTGNIHLNGIEEHEQGITEKCDKNEMYTGYYYVHRWNKKDKKGVWYWDSTPYAQGHHWGHCEGTSVEEMIKEAAEELILEAFE